jgi:hypothetical protein
MLTDVCRIVIAGLTRNLQSQGDAENAELDSVSA